MIAEVEKYFDNLCKEITVFDIACNEAKTVHEGDLYGDKDYYEYHLLGVVDLISRGEFLSRDLMTLKVVGVLHDAHEDHNVPLDFIEISYGVRVRDAIDAISYRKGQETRDEYYIRCASNRIAKKVKMYDAIFNMMNCRLEGDATRVAYYQKVVDIMSKD